LFTERVKITAMKHRGSGVMTQLQTSQWWRQQVR